MPVANPAPPPPATAEPLLAFNLQVLAQAAALAQAHRDLPVERYVRPTGAHLRHVIEHYLALLRPAQAGVVDYDARARDTVLEHSAARAAERLQALADAVRALDAAALRAPLRVRGLCGLAGEAAFEAPSTLGRELAFVASHAVHHFAVIQAEGLDPQIAVPTAFGRAPATVAHARDHATPESTAPQEATA